MIVQHIPNFVDNENVNGIKITDFSTFQLYLIDESAKLVISAAR